MTINQAKSRTIDSKAPTRVDLAGGTVDIWPLYLFLDEPTTINLGIDLFAQTRLTETVHAPASSAQVTLRSGDQGAELKLKWDEIDTASAPPTLELHLKFLRYFRKIKEKNGYWDKNSNIEIATSAKSPAGAGLGGSSTLSISMIGALASWAKGGVDSKEIVDPVLEGESLIEIARDVETTVIQVPAGLQDYYGAMFGGLQSIKWKAGAHQRSWLNPDLIEGIEKRLLLFYSGHSRNSGINNWALYKSFIDKQGPVRDQFAGIVRATQDLEKALLKQDWNAAGEAIRSEWNTRRTLASGISTAEMDKAFELAMQKGATAGKVCGAGGGGCFFVYLPSPTDALRNELKSQIESLGIRHLPFTGQKRGLSISIEHSSQVDRG